jgi:type VI protein secretion system component VasK
LKIAEQTGHIQYLQRRIKEIVDETQDKEEFRRPDELTSAAIKKELDTLGTEVIAIRDVLRAEQRKEGAMVNIKVSTYDEFRLRVLDELIIWDIKSAELAKAAT